MNKYYIIKENKEDPCYLFWVEFVSLDESEILAVISQKHKHTNYRFFDNISKNFYSINRNLRHSISWSNDDAILYSKNILKNFGYLEIPKNLKMLI